MSLIGRTFWILLELRTMEVVLELQNVQSSSQIVTMFNYHKHATY